MIGGDSRLCNRDQAMALRGKGMYLLAPLQVAGTVPTMSYLVAKTIKMARKSLRSLRYFDSTYSKVSGTQRARFGENHDIWIAV
jgi:hypothetical protein